MMRSKVTFLKLLFGVNYLDLIYLKMYLKVYISSITDIRLVDISK